MVTMGSSSPAGLETAAAGFILDAVKKKTLRISLHEGPLSLAVYLWSLLILVFLFIVYYCGFLFVENTDNSFKLLKTGKTKTVPQYKVKQNLLKICH